jgi:hypothetical protein
VPFAGDLNRLPKRLPVLASGECCRQSSADKTRKLALHNLRPEELRTDDRQSGLCHDHLQMSGDFKQRPKENVPGEFCCHRTCLRLSQWSVELLRMKSPVRALERE